MSVRIRMNLVGGSPGQNVLSINETVSRAQLAQGMGLSYKGYRDIDEACGYPQDIGIEEYSYLYRRFGPAKRIVTAYPDESWRLQPIITEDEDPKVTTPFEAAWEALTKDDNLKLFKYLWILDRRCGIGQYGILVLGFNDGKDLKEPIETSKGMKLVYIREYDQKQATIKETEKDASNPRFGMPTMYEVAIGNTTNQQVHWSRVLHVAENAESSPVYGTPRLESVYNQILDLRKVLGGSAEMYWRGAFPGMVFKLDPEIELSDSQKEDFKEQIRDYVHSLTRDLRVQGMEVEQLEPNIVSPEGHLLGLFQVLSASTGIPLRILLGSERGELSSTQDHENWISRVETRQMSFVEPEILRPFIRRMMGVGVLPVSESYNVVWPSLYDMSDIDKVEVSKGKTEALVKYGSSVGAQTILPLQYFLELILGMEPDTVDEIVNEIEDQFDDENDEEVREGRTSDDI